MLVRTTAAHGNRYGSNYRKAEGDEYDAPEAVAVKLKALGLVGDAEQPAPAKPASKKAGAKA